MGNYNKKIVTETSPQKMDKRNTKSLTPSSSVKSSTSIVMEGNYSETRDSCYFPGCKKDANCNCEICLASINATLDLKPLSSLTKLSVSRLNNVEKTPISFDSSVISTPRSSPYKTMESPALKSTARLIDVRVKEMEKKNTERGFNFWGIYLKLASVLSLLLLVEFGFSFVISGILRPTLSADVVRSIGEKSWIVKDLNGRLRFLERGLKGVIVNGEISNCSYRNSKWKINQDGFLLNSHCVLYKSAIEQVSIWGWPLQTAGLLSTGFSTRSFTILSGRATEWSSGEVGFSTRKANTSWLHKKWGASAIQLDPNTWILEYRQSSLLENSRFFSSALELSKYHVLRWVRRMNEGFWRFSDFQDLYRRHLPEERVKIPT